MDHERAFDAVESYLSETDREPSAKWRTASLVTAIHGLIRRGPEFGRPTPEARQHMIRRAAAELTARGLDALSLIRYGMPHEVTAPVTSALLLKLMFGDSIAFAGVDAVPWCAALGIESLEPFTGENSFQETVDQFAKIIVPAMPRIRQWVSSASLDEIIELVPPRRGVLGTSAVAIAGERELRNLYRWAVDHFAKTFYKDWATTSLHNEFRWLDGDMVSPCPAELMRDRSVLKKDLSEEIARRAVYQTPAPDAGSSVVDEMTRHAGSLLRQGRYKEAAAVFEFGVRQRPDDPDIKNNLGFCMIPVNPRVALDHLKMAANIGYRSTATNSYNQMCCYVNLGRPQAALNIAEFEWHRISSKIEQVEAMLLWRLSDSGEWELTDHDDVAKAIAAFAADIARREGWTEQEEFWRATEATRATLPKDSAK